MTREEIIPTIKWVVEQLYQGNFDTVYNQDEGKRLSADEMRTAINGYAGSMTLPPVSAYGVYEDYGDEDSDQYFIEFTLWYKGSKSDLTLSVTIKRDAAFSIEDIRVL